MLVASAFGVAFCALTVAVVAPGSALRRLDDAALAALSRARRPRLDLVVGPLSMFATQEPLTLQAFVAFVLIAVTLGRPAATQLVVVAVGSGALNEVVKRLVARPRPAGPRLIPWFRGYSYPSGDLLTATAIYATIATIATPHLPTPGARAAVFAMMPSVLAVLGFARVYVGVHHPTDVVAGMLLGAAWAAVVAAWLG
jgi:membrane-associated phospholipid phosphatase